MDQPTPHRWKRRPRPDPEVLALIEQLREAASIGSVRTLVVVTMNPLLEIESAHAGEVDRVRKLLLMGGLLEASMKVNEIN